MPSAVTGRSGIAVRTAKALAWLLAIALLLIAGLFCGVALVGWSGSPEKQLQRLVRPLGSDGLGGLAAPKAGAINEAFAAISSRYKRDQVSVDRDARLQVACVVECALIWTLTVRTLDSKGEQLPESIYIAFHANVEPYPADARAMVAAPSPFQWREKSWRWSYTRRYGPGVLDHVQFSGDYEARRPDVVLANESEIAAVLNVMGERIRAVIAAENDENALMPKGIVVD